MRVLALDTTTRGGSLALVEDDRVLVERDGDAARPHAERLPADLMSLLDAAAAPMSSVDVYAVAAGPGSFTGLRIGMATMQGLAFVNRRPMVAVSAVISHQYWRRCGERVERRHGRHCTGRRGSDDKTARCHEKCYCRSPQPLLSGVKGAAHETRQPDRHTIHCRPLTFELKNPSHKSTFRAKQLDGSF